MIKHVRLTLDKCLSSVYPSPKLTFSHGTKTEQHSCKKDSWPQIDGSITVMRKYGEFLIRSSEILVNIHWYTQLHDMTDQSNRTKWYLTRFLLKVEVFISSSLNHGMKLSGSLLECRKLIDDSASLWKHHKQSAHYSVRERSRYPKSYSYESYEKTGEYSR